MSRVSPTLEGFRAAFRRPSLTLTEIAWRWSIGALAWALLFFWFIEYLRTLPVTNADATLLSTRQPVLVGRAIAHILRGSLNRAALALFFAVIALTLLWIIVASIGRAAILSALLDYFRKNESDNVSAETSDATLSRPLLPLIGLNVLRAALTLAAMLAFVGAAILVRFISSRADQQPGVAFVLFLLLTGLICIAWPGLNWLLSFAGIFVVHDGEDALGALSAAMVFYRERSAAVFAVSTWTGLAHLAAFVGASMLVALPLAFVHVAPVRLVVAGVILVALAYCAVADWLYLARLAGYICIAETPRDLATSALLTSSRSTGQESAPSLSDLATIDRDESILSDVPGLAVET